MIMNQSSTPWTVYCLNRNPRLVTYQIIITPTSVETEINLNKYVHDLIEIFGLLATFLFVLFQEEIAELLTMEAFLKVFFIEWDTLCGK